MTVESPQQNVSDSSDTIAMIVEIVFGLFGILGMGWLYAGNIAIAIAAFIGFAILVFIEALIATFTGGIALCLILPFNVAVVVISALRARDYVRNTGAKGTILYVVIGILVGIVVICLGLSLIIGGLGALGNLQNT